MFEAAANDLPSDYQVFTIKDDGQKGEILFARGKEVAGTSRTDVVPNMYGVWASRVQLYFPRFTWDKSQRTGASVRAQFFAKPLSR